MFSERVLGIFSPRGKVVVKVQLVAEPVPCPDRLRLTGLHPPNFASGGEQRLRLLDRGEEHAVRIGENGILPADAQAAEPGAGERLRLPRVESLWGPAGTAP